VTVAVRDGRSVVARLPGLVRGDVADEHERRLPAAPLGAGGQPQAYRAEGDEREVEGKGAVVLVLAGREVLPGPVVLELERELMVGDAPLERAAPPQYFPRSDAGIEPLDLFAYEEMVLLLGELLAHVHRLVLENGAVLSH
jgi:hypothetical protein